MLVRKENRIIKKSYKCEGREGTHVEDATEKMYSELKNQHPRYKELTLPVIINIPNLSIIETDQDSVYDPETDTESNYKCLMGKANVTVELNGLYNTHKFSKKAQKDKQDLRITCTAIIVPPEYKDPTRTRKAQLALDSCKKSFSNIKGFLSLCSSTNMIDGYGFDETVETFYARKLLSNDEVLFSTGGYVEPFTKGFHGILREILLGISKKDVAKIHSWFEDMIKKYGSKNGSISYSDAEDMVRSMGISIDDGEYEDLVDAAMIDTESKNYRRRSYRK
jgi:hypothetical protein